VPLTGLIAAVVAISPALLAGCSGDKGSPPATTSVAPTTSTTSPTVSDDTAPLTGLPQSDAAVRARGVVAVKIDNVAPTKPQAGLQNADLVFEEPVEGGLTRLMAVFQTKDITRVGPVRSARIPDASLVRAMGGGLLIYSGASKVTSRMLREEQPKGVTLLPEGSRGWTRDSRRHAPHNLFVDERLARRSRSSDAVTARRQFAFADATPSGGEKASSVALRWSATKVTWTWNDDRERWLRTQSGRKDVMETGGRIAATNVVVLQVETTTDPRLKDKTGAHTPLPDLLAGGRAWLLRDGVVVPGRWQRQDADSPFTLVDDSGQELGLRPGRSWIELLTAPAVPSVT